MLGALLRVGEQLGGEPGVLLGRRAAAAGAGDRVQQRPPRRRPGRPSGAPPGTSRRCRSRRSAAGTCTGSGWWRAAPGRRPAGRRRSAARTAARRTIWKHSPARIASLAASTAFGYAPSGVRLTTVAAPRTRPPWRPSAGWAGTAPWSSRPAGRSPGGRRRPTAVLSSALVGGQDRVGDQDRRARRSGPAPPGRWRASCPAPARRRSSLGQLRQPLEAAHQVVAEVADQAAGQRRQAGVGRGSTAPASAATVSRSTAIGSPVGRHARRRLCRARPPRRPARSAWRGCARR